MLLLVLLALLATAARSERMSGLYVDNGFDQTVVQRVTSLRQKRAVEHEILDLLGLPEPPLKHRGAFGVSDQVKRSAPKFLLDIYKNALGSGSHVDSDPELDLGQWMRTIEQSDAIMTFAAHSLQVTGEWLWFDVSMVPANQLILGAELRLYRSLRAAKTSKNHESFLLTAYLEDGERELQYIDSVNASSSHEGWIIFNVSKALNYWLQNPLGNRGLHVSIHSADPRVDEMTPEDIGIQGVNGAVERQPFMVAFFESSGLREHSIRRKREAKRNKRSDYINFDFRSNPYIAPQMPRRSPRSCQIRTLYVNFRDLEWHNWIIAPDGYDAYYCSGECNFPLNARTNSTNHAIVQSLVHVMYPGRIPKPCCAPTKLSSLTVIYYLNENNVMLRTYKDMVVKNCGCH